MTAPDELPNLPPPYKGGEIIPMHYESAHFRVAVSPELIRYDATDSRGERASPVSSQRMADIARQFPLATELFADQYIRSDENAPARTVSVAIPTAAGLNRFKRDYLEPLGGNSFTFAYADPDPKAGIPGQFEPRTIVDEGLANGRFLLSRDDYYILCHDTADHGLAMAGAPQRTMEFVQKFAQHIRALRDENPELADKLTLRLAHAMDRETEFDLALWRPSNLRPNNESLPARRGEGSRILTKILDERYENSEVIPHVREALETAGFEIGKSTDERGSEIDVVTWERDELPEYYAKIWRKLSEQPRDPVRFRKSFGFFRQLIGRATLVASTDLDETAA